MKYFFSQSAFCIAASHPPVHTRSAGANRGSASYSNTLRRRSLREQGDGTSKLLITTQPLYLLGHATLH